MKSIINPFTSELQKTPNNLTDIDTRSHTDLSNIGSNTHAQIDSALALNATHRSGAIMTHPVIEQNIMLNAFRTAVVGSLSVQKMVDGFTDEYEDETGVDTAGSTGESYDATNDLYKPIAGYQSNILAESGLVSYWKMDNNWNDSKGSNHGTATGATFGTAKYGTYSGSFDGLDDYVNVPTSAGIINNGPGTIELWFKANAIPSSAGQYGYIYLQLNTIIGADVRIYLYGDGSLNFSGHNGTSYQFGITTPFTDTTSWHHVVGVWSATDTRFYLDNVLIGSDTNVDMGSFTPNEITIGSGRFANSYFNGLIDEVAVYNTALSASTISDHYNALADTTNMTLLSVAQTAESTPTQARIVLFEEDVDAITLGTHLKSYVSRDNGTTYTQIILSDEGDYDTNKRILTGTADISAQPAGTSMKYKVETLNAKNLKLHGASLLWQ